MLSPWRRRSVSGGSARGQTRLCGTDVGEGSFPLVLPLETAGVEGVLETNISDLSKKMYLTNSSEARRTVINYTERPCQLNCEAAHTEAFSLTWSMERLNIFQSRYSWRGILSISPSPGPSPPGVRSSSSSVAGEAEEGRPNESPVTSERKRLCRCTTQRPSAMMTLTRCTTGLGLERSSSCIERASSSRCHVGLLGSVGHT